MRTLFILALFVGLFFSNTMAAPCHEWSTSEMEAEEGRHFKIAMENGVRLSIAAIFVNMLSDNHSKATNKVAIESISKVFCDFKGKDREEALALFRLMVGEWKEWKKKATTKKIFFKKGGMGGHPGGMLTLILSYLFFRFFVLLLLAYQREGSYLLFKGYWEPIRGMVIVAIFISGVLAWGGAYAETASYGGCSVSEGVQVIEVIEGACSPKVLKALTREVGLSCHPWMMEEAASLSLAASSEEGLSEEALLRKNLLEAICPSPEEEGKPPLLMLGILLGLSRRRGSLVRLARLPFLARGMFNENPAIYRDPPTKTFTFPQWDELWVFFPNNIENSLARDHIVIKKGWHRLKDICHKTDCPIVFGGNFNEDLSLSYDARALFLYWPKYRVLTPLVSEVGEDIEGIFPWE